MAAGGGTRNSTAKSTTKRRNKKRQNHHHHNHHRCQESLTQLISLVASATTAAHSFLSQQDLHLLPSQTLTLESKISSSTLSLSRLLALSSVSIPLLNPPPSTCLAPPPPSPCWFHRFLSSAASDDYDPRWVDAFRMSKASFTLLLRLLTPSLNCLSPIPPNYALAAALFRLSHGASYKSVARRFMLDSATACRAFYMVCKVINDRLGHLFEFRSDINRIVVGFGWISLPNCCGVLGFDEFEVEGGGGESLSLVVQALVDSEGRFLDVSAGWPSTMKPETIFRQSKLFSGVEESREVLNGPSFELSNGNSIPQYVLGDSCFPLLPWLLTPYDVVESDSDNNNKKKNGLNWNSSEMKAASLLLFNSVHSRGIELVGMAFGRVRARWQLLSKKPWKKECIQSFPFIIVTCCLLHNFLVKCSEPLPGAVAGENVARRCCYSRDQTLPSFEGDVDENGQRIRDVLAWHLNWVNQRR